MGSVTVTIQTVDDQAIPAPLDGVLVRVFDAAGTTFITQGNTGAVVSGQVQFTLFGDGPGVNYTLRLSKAGFSFPPAPTFIVLVQDPPGGSGNTFQFAAVTGLTGEIVKFVVQTDDLTPLPVEDVRLKVFDAADTFLTELLTDSSGEGDLVLDGDPDPGRNYIIRLRPPAGLVVIDGPTQVVKVHEPLVAPNTNIFDFVTSEEELPQSTDPDMCLMSGFLVDQALRPLENMKLRFIPLLEDPDARVSGFPFPSDPTVLQRQMLLREAVFQTDSDGYVEVLLPKKACFEVHIHGFEMPGLPTVAQIQVPDALAAQLEDVLFPFTASVEWGSAALPVTLGETEELTLDVLGSNDQEIAASIMIDALLEFTIDDTDVAIFQLNEDGNLLITGLSAGTAELSVARKPDTFAPRVPDVPDLIVTPSTTVTITVT
jgi:hypothetical protein